MPRRVALAAMTLVCASGLTSSFVDAQTTHRPQKTPSTASRHPSRTTRPAEAPSGPTVVLRGTIARSDTTRPLAMSTVEIVETHLRRFSDPNGHFAIKLPPGEYHLRVRQIGFKPRDTVVVLPASATTVDLTMTLTAVVLQLRPMAVTALLHCSRPGVDSADEPALYDIVAAVRENASREMLLRRSYPFEYRVDNIRTSTTVGDGAPYESAHDTLWYRSDRVASYAIGSTIFTDQTDPRGAGERMRLPATSDFADPHFLGTHCFAYDIAESGDYVLHFIPLDTISAPDVAGTVTLDSTSFVLRTLAVHLTRPQNVGAGFEQLEVVTTYREAIRSVAIPASIVSKQRFRLMGDGAVQVIAEEKQVTRSLRFLGRVPDGVSKVTSAVW